MRGKVREVTNYDKGLVKVRMKVTDQAELFQACSKHLRMKKEWEEVNSNYTGFPGHVLSLRKAESLTIFKEM